MIVFPNCKINLGLNISGKRADGYHNLETAFYPLPFYDVLEIIQAANTAQYFDLVLSGVKLEGDIHDNLCAKAYHLLKRDFPGLPAIKTHLHKTIPAGAGLGGGSADGAFMLMLLNDKFDLHMPKEQLLHYALLLGSDCSFFIINKPCIGRQRGEELEPVDINLSGYKLVLVNPGIHINTAWAFTRVKFSPCKNIKDVIIQPVEEWKEQLFNDFESPVFEQFPEIEAIKKNLYTSGALYASMSGTGSSVYGIFSQKTPVNILSFPQHYFVKEVLL